MVYKYSRYTLLPTAKHMSKMIESFFDVIIGFFQTFSPMATPANRMTIPIIWIFDNLSL